MDILMSETCWAHKKWNKIASDLSWSFILQVSQKVGDVHHSISVLGQNLCMTTKWKEKMIGTRQRFH